jgi:hypothetical protein
MLETIAAMLFEPWRFPSNKRIEDLRNLVRRAWKEERDPGARDLEAARSTGFRERLGDYGDAIFGRPTQVLATNHGVHARSEAKAQGKPDAWAVDRARAAATEAFASEVYVAHSAEISASVDDGNKDVSAADVLAIVRDAIANVREGDGYGSAKKFSLIENVLYLARTRIAEARGKSRSRSGLSARTAERKPPTEETPTTPWLSLRNASPMFAILSVEAGDWPRRGEDEIPLEFGGPDGLAVSAVAAMISRSQAHASPSLPLGLMVTCFNEAVSRFRAECSMPPLADGPLGYPARLEQCARISVDLAAALRRWPAWEPEHVRLPRVLDDEVRIDAKPESPRAFADETVATMLEILASLSFRHEGQDLFASYPLVSFEMDAEDAEAINRQIREVRQRIEKRWNDAINRPNEPTG